MRKPTFAYAKTKTQISFAVTAISFAVTAKLISAFVFASWIVQSLYYLNPKFQASRHLLWRYRLVCVGPGRKPECWFSHDTAQMLWLRHYVIMVLLMSTYTSYFYGEINNFIGYLSQNNHLLAMTVVQC